MTVQVSLDNANIPFVLSGNALSRDDQVLLTDAGRVIPLAPFTVLAKVAATQKWVPFTNAAATDGSAVPQGIYIGESVTAAAIVAGDIVDLNVLLGGAITIDVDQLVIENSLTLDTVITVGTTDLRTVRDHLANRGIFVEDTVDISSFESA